MGHLERFNPAIVAVWPVVNRPLYFEVHRLGVFTPRSLDIDVVYDVMIHDLDILLALINEPAAEVRSLGIPVVTDKVDIAHARARISVGRGSQCDGQPASQWNACAKCASFSSMNTSRSITPGKTRRAFRVRQPGPAASV